MVGIIAIVWGTFWIGVGMVLDYKNYKACMNIHNPKLKGMVLRNNYELYYIIGLLFIIAGIIILNGR